MPERDDEAGCPPQRVTDPTRMFDLGLRETGIGLAGAWTAPVGDPALCKQAFDAAVASQEPPRAADEAVTVNTLLLEVFGPEEVLRLPEFVATHDRLAKRKIFRIERYARPDPDPRTYEAAGTFAGRCSQLRLIAIEEAEGAHPRIRLLDREMQFAIQGRKAVRIRGLTPAEQDRRDRDARAAARRNDSLDRKAREAATSSIGGLLNELVRLDRRATVPGCWHSAGFLPEDLVGRSVAEAAAFIVEYHHVAAFDRARLAEWQARLARAVEQAAKLTPSPRAPAVSDPGAIEVDDEAALATLARTEGI